MTVIACKVNKGFIEMASDSQTTWGRNKYPQKDITDMEVKASGKIYKTNGVIMGCSGDNAHIGLMQLFCKTHLPKRMDKDSIMEWFIEFKEWSYTKAKIEFDKLYIQGIIVKDKRVFAFFDHLEIFEIKTFFAVGSGAYIALGAMESGVSVKRAVEVAIKYDLYCGGKVNYIKI